jgi:hypothetical protein
MVGTIYAHFKPKTMLVGPLKDEILKKNELSAQEYDEETKLLKFRIYDNFDHARKLKGELWDLLRKEKVVGC